MPTCHSTNTRQWGKFTEVLLFSHSKYFYTGGEDALLKLNKIAVSNPQMTAKTLLYLTLVSQDSQ